MTYLKDLTQYHQDRVMTNARRWRDCNHALIICRMKAERTHTAAEPKAPDMFDPNRWTGANWLWFSKLITGELLKQ